MQTRRNQQLLAQAYSTSEERHQLSHGLRSSLRHHQRWRQELKHRGSSSKVSGGALLLLERVAITEPRRDILPRKLLIQAMLSRRSAHLRSSTGVIANNNISTNSFVESKDPFARLSSIKSSSLGPYKGLAWKRVENTARYMLDSSIPLIIPMFGSPLGLPNSFFFYDFLCFFMLFRIHEDF